MRNAALVAALLITLLLAPNLRAADTIPAAIADAEFWKMVSDYSEPGDTFDFPMFMSNEVTFQTVLPDLLKRVSPGGVYLGVAPEQNFTYIAALKPKIAFIIDIRRENMLEMLMYKALFEMSSNRAEFVSKLFSRKAPAGSDPQQASVDGLFDALARVRNDSAYFAQNLQMIKDRLQKTHGFALSEQDNKTIEYIYGLFFRAGPDAHLTTYGTSYQLLMRETDDRGQNRNFLASESNFQFVRQMQQKNLIIPVVGDFAGPKAIRAVARYLQNHAAPVTAFYVSNVEEYISFPRSVWSAYCRNIATLPLNQSSTFIRFGRSGRGSYLGAMGPFINSCSR